MRRHVMRAASCALICGGLLAVNAGCSSTEPAGRQTPTAPEPPVGAWSDEEAALPAFTVDEPAWSAPTSTSDGPIADVDIRGGAVIVGDGAHVAVLDAGTGSVRWTLQADQELPGGDGATFSAGGASQVTGSDEDWTILIPYQRESDANTEYEESPERGVAALDAAGAVSWMTPITPSASPYTPESHLVPVITDAGSSIASVSVAPDDYDSSPATHPSLIHSAAVDLATGEVLWERRGQWAVAVTDAAVLTVRTPRLPVNSQPNGPRFEESTVFALDPASGRSMWKKPAHAIRAVAAEKVLVTREPRSGEDRPPSAVVDIESGDKAADFGAGVRWCDSDRGDSIACIAKAETGDEHLVTYDAESDDALTSQAPVPGEWSALSGVADGYAFISKEEKDGQHHSYVLDPTAEQPDGPYPAGSLAAASDQYIAMIDYPEDEPAVITVYERE